MGRSRGMGRDDDLPMGLSCREHRGRYSMEVLAYIPELPCPTGAMEPSAVLDATSVALKTAPASSPSEPSVECVPVPAVSLAPAPRRSTARQSQANRFFSPSIIALMAVAAVVWAAAWRNDQLRLEAARQQRPERMAQELPPTAGANRSVTP